MCQSNIYTLSRINSTIIIWSFILVYYVMCMQVYCNLIVFSEKEKIKDLVLDNPVTLTFKAQLLKLTSSFLSRFLVWLSFSWLMVGQTARICSHAPNLIIFFKRTLVFLSVKLCVWLLFSHHLIKSKTYNCHFDTWLSSSPQVFSIWYCFPGGWKDPGNEWSLSHGEEARFLCHHCGVWFGAARLVYPACYVLLHHQKESHCLHTGNPPSPAHCTGNLLQVKKLIIERMNALQKENISNSFYHLICESK